MGQMGSGTDTNKVDNIRNVKAGVLKKRHKEKNLRVNVFLFCLFYISTNRLCVYGLMGILQQH